MYYFQLIRFAKEMTIWMLGGLDGSLDVLLMAPIQRVAHYQLVLSDINFEIKKAINAAADGETELTKEQMEKAAFMKDALNLSSNLAQYVDDMMDAGKIQAYPVSVKIAYFVIYNVILSLLLTAKLSDSL